jgi:hypothetical protein
MFLKGTLTSRKDQGAANPEEEAAAEEAVADTAACMKEAATAISVSDAVDMVEAAEAAAVVADAGIRAVGTKEEEEEEGSFPSTFIFYCWKIFRIHFLTPRTRNFGFLSP